MDHLLGVGDKVVCKNKNYDIILPKLYNFFKKGQVHTKWSYYLGHVAQ